MKSDRFNLKHENDRFFESICPLTAVAVFPRESHSLIDYLIYPRYLLAISLIGARYRTLSANGLSHFRHVPA